MDYVDKPGLHRRLRRFHHTRCVIYRRAHLAYQLGFSPMPIRWQPFRKCWRTSDHRLYAAIGVECPCEWDKSSWWRVSREKNPPTNELADHKTCSCSAYRRNRKLHGNTRAAFTNQEVRALDSCEQQIEELASEGNLCYWTDAYWSLINHGYQSM